MSRLALAGLIVLSMAIATPACGPAEPVGGNIVLLISVDSWRWDYLDLFEPPHLTALADRGVRAEGLIPAFPSKTFPNHHTIITGLYPDHHGVVGNTMDDDRIGERFTISAATAEDPAWWGGEPLWATAKSAGLRTASMFWPGSDVPMPVGQPDDWHPYDTAFPNARRVEQILDWLARPEDTRPSFITLYFSDVDSAAHVYGPESPETAEAVAYVDGLVGEVVAGIDALGLTDRLTLIVVSDHGIATLDEDRQVFLDDYVDMSTLDITVLGEYLAVAPRSGSPSELVEALADRHPALNVFAKEDAPARLHYGDHERIPPVLGLVDDGWMIRTRARPLRANPGGAHGYDPAFRSMHGLFVAAGPGLRSGVDVPSFDNVHLYEFMARLLRVSPSPNDGDPAMTAGFFR